MIFAILQSKIQAEKKEIISDTVIYKLAFYKDKLDYKIITICNLGRKQKVKKNIARGTTDPGY